MVRGWSAIYGTGENIATVYDFQAMGKIFITLGYCNCGKVQFTRDYTG